MLRYVLAGAVAGAMPATVMEFAQPTWQPAVITAFAMPMAASGLFGYLVWMITHEHHHRS